MHGLFPYTDDLTGERKIRVRGPHGDYDVVPSLIRPGTHEVWKVGQHTPRPAARHAERVDALEAAGDLAGLDL